MQKTKYGIDALLDFLSEGKTPFHAVAACEKRLTEAGFTPLSEGEAWNLTPGAGYYVTRNRSSILAFRAPVGELRGFMIAASHTDSSRSLSPGLRGSQPAALKALYHFRQSAQKISTREASAMKGWWSQVSLRRRFFSGSVTRMIVYICWLPPVGACMAAFRML